MSTSTTTATRPRGVKLPRKVGRFQLSTIIAAVAIAHGGSISACHGACRAGEVDLVPEEMGGGWDVMKKVKRALDPLNIMNPGKVFVSAEPQGPDPTTGPQPSSPRLY